MDATVEDDIVEDAPTEEVEQAVRKRAIHQSIVDLATPTAPPTTHPSVGETSSLQAPAPAMDQHESTTQSVEVPAPATAPVPTPALDEPVTITPSVEVPLQTELSSVLAYIFEGDLTNTQPAIDSVST